METAPSGHPQPSPHPLSSPQLSHPAAPSTAAPPSLPLQRQRRPVLPLPEHPHLHRPRPWQRKPMPDCHLHQWHRKQNRPATRRKLRPRHITRQLYRPARHPNHKLGPFALIPERTHYALHMQPIHHRRVPICWQMRVQPHQPMQLIHIHAEELILRQRKVPIPSYPRQRGQPKNHPNPGCAESPELVVLRLH
jgi:hypothetical protein